ncbi:hypothetical protein Tco_1132727 [Tanacetum coccineum]|uniref:Uncharacterized protein n=1 Tax=Tanacetum coccineum TaxID=301880 RepID=A0ABQ5JCS1_9ASTR
MMAVALDGVVCFRFKSFLVVVVRLDLFCNDEVLVGVIKTLWLEFSSLVLLMVESVWKLVVLSLMCFYACGIVAVSAPITLAILLHEYNITELLGSPMAVDDLLQNLVYIISIESNDLIEISQLVQSLLSDFTLMYKGFKYSLGNSYAMTANVIENPRGNWFKEVRKACCVDGPAECKASELAALTLVYGEGPEYATLMYFSNLRMA